MPERSLLKLLPAAVCLVIFLAVLLIARSFFRRATRGETVQATVRRVEMDGSIPDIHPDVTILYVFPWQGRILERPVGPRKNHSAAAHRAAAEYAVRCKKRPAAGSPNRPPHVMPDASLRRGAVTFVHRRKRLCVFERQPGNGGGCYPSHPGRLPVCRRFLHHPAPEEFPEAVGQWEHPTRSGGVPGIRPPGGR